MHSRFGLALLAFSGALWLGPMAWPGGSVNAAAPLKPVSFADLSGWKQDDHAAALHAFQRSCRALKRGSALAGVCREALGLPPATPDAEARAFFERAFTPYRVEGRSEGFLTGYYEPELDGSRDKRPGFAVPVYATPSDLVVFKSGMARGGLPAAFTGARKSTDGIIAYPTRREIEQKGLGSARPLLYLADPVEAYFMHVQGSGRVRLRDGSHVRLSFAAKNGHPYTSIGKILINRGAIAEDSMSMDAVKSWLRANPRAGRDLFWENRSYIFFRELHGPDAERGPVGGAGCTLTPGRSLAVDAAFHRLGTPVWVDSPTMRLAGPQALRRLMIAQDTGSAIKGSERGDIFWGMGQEAGALAGQTRHPGSFTVLLPRP